MPVKNLSPIILAIVSGQKFWNSVSKVQSQSPQLSSQIKMGAFSKRPGNSVISGKVFFKNQPTKQTKRSALKQQSRWGKIWDRWVHEECKILSLKTSYSIKEFYGDSKYLPVIYN